MREIMAVVLLVLGGLSGVAKAEINQMSQKELLFRAFPSGGQDPQVLNLAPALQQQLEAVLGHPYDGKRIRYWRKEGTTAWVLDEIGKEEPITIGVVVSEGRISLLQVMTYREDHGAEVMRPGFVAQFDGMGLTAQGRLDRRIDGITGATMSVRSVAKVAKMALMLHKEVTAGAATP